MEKHNTHIVLDSNSSEKHDYEEDENGNVKIEENEDVAYRSFIQKKPKMSIKQIIIDNNNILKDELEKNNLSEEKQKNNIRKKKKVNSGTYIRGEEYRFNEKKIKPCFNEVELKFNKFKKSDENDKQNLSQEVKEQNEKFKNDISYDNKKKRNTMYMLNPKKNKENDNNNINKKEQKNNNKSKNKSYSSIHSDIIKENEIKEKNDIIKSDKSSEIIFLKNKIIYNENDYKFKEKNINESFNDNSKDKSNKKLNNNDINDDNSINNSKIKNDENNKEEIKSSNRNVFIDINDEKDKNILESQPKDDKIKNNINDNENHSEIEKEEINNNNNEIISDNNIIFLREKLTYNENEKLLYNHSNKTIEKNNTNKNNDSNINMNESNEINNNDKQEKNKEIQNENNKENNNNINNNSSKDNKEMNKSYNKENPHNLSHNKNQKNIIGELSEKEKKLKRNTMPHLIKGKNYNNNANSNIKADNNNNKNNNLNSEQENDIQSNNTEIKNNENKRKENEEYNEENKSIKLNSQNENTKDEINNNDIIDNNKNDENINENSYKNNNNENFKNEIINNSNEEDNNENNNNNDNISNSNNISNNISNKSNTNYKNNIASNSRNFPPNQKRNTNFNFNKKNQKMEISKDKNKIKRNTMNALPNKNNLNNKNEKIDEGENLHLLLEKLQYDDNSYDINKNSYENQKNINDINISNGQNNKGEKYFNKNKFKDTNGQRNSQYIDNDNKIFNNELNDDDNPITNNNNNNSEDENNIKQSDNEKEGTDEFLKEKVDEEDINQENKKRISTEEYLENNLEKENSINKEKSESNSNINNKNKNNNNTYKESSNYISSKDLEKEEIIIIKQILPINYIEKIRQKNIKINKLIPKKKRVFISKLINPHELYENNENQKEEINFPKIPLCYMTNKYIIKNDQKIMKTIINKYFFRTKLVTKKEEQNKKKLKIIKKISKFPKVYEKAIISPTNKSLFRSKTKGSKQKKDSDIIDITKDKDNLEINFKHKNKKRKEKISLISKDKNILENEDNNNEGNIIIKQNNKIIKELSPEKDSNQIELSIQFSNKAPLGISNIKRLKKYPSSAKKKHKNLVDSLYKDLREINSKLENKEDYIKKNYYNLHYDRHVGDEKTCPICREVRKRGRRMEREKGLFSAFSFRNYKKINKKAFAKLKISLQQKSKENNEVIWNNIERQKYYNDNNIFSMNNIDNDFRTKYMQFNGMNRFNKLNRYGSTENLSKYRYNNDKRSFRNLNLNMDKEMEKNEDDMFNWQFPALNNYFHD